MKRVEGWWCWEWSGQRSETCGGVRCPGNGVVSRSGKSEHTSEKSNQRLGIRESVFGIQHKKGAFNLPTIFTGYTESVTLCSAWHEFKQVKRWVARCTREAPHGAPSEWNGVETFHYRRCVHLWRKWNGEVVRRYGEASGHHVHRRCKPFHFLQRCITPGYLGAPPVASSETLQVHATSFKYLAYQFENLMTMS